MIYTETMQKIDIKIIKEKKVMSKILATLDNKYHLILIGKNWC